MVKLMGSPSRLVSGYTLYLGTGSRVRRISVSGEDQLSCAWSAREATCSSDHGDPFRAADARGRGHRIVEHCALGSREVYRSVVRRQVRHELPGGGRRAPRERQQLTVFRCLWHLTILLARSNYLRCKCPHLPPPWRSVIRSKKRC